MTNEQRADRLLKKLNDANQGMFSDPRSTEKRDIILAFADEIRRECAEKAWDYVASKATSQTFGMGLTKHDMESAIMGKEVGG